MNQVYRMGEFYDMDDLDYFIGTVRSNNLNEHDAMRWLDMQTRVNYVTGVETEPNIHCSLLGYLLEIGLDDSPDLS